MRIASINASGCNAMLRWRCVRGHEVILIVEWHDVYDPAILNRVEYREGRRECRSFNGLPNVGK